MATTQDFTAMLQDFMGAFPVDTKAFEGVYQNQAVLGEKLAGVTLEAAEKSSEVSAKWAKETISKLADVTKVQSEPANYAKAMTDFASAQAEVASENLAAFAEIAKKVQLDTVELMMAAGKNMSEDASSAVQKATKDATAAAKKASAAK